ncbi:hypothetical protein [Pedobacter yulinensis]|nr:hypothetical protein [Pedobacter yulinensis]
MKQIVILLVLTAGWSTAFAQSSERRNTLQMQIIYKGKTVSTELNSVNTSITRYPPEEVPADTRAVSKDSAAVKTPATARPASANDSFYLSMEAKTVQPELLRILAAPDALFDGSITVTDSFGKNPQRTIRFKGGRLYTYSDQFAGIAYSEQYGSAVLSISCNELSIDGIPFQK